MSVVATSGAVPLNSVKLTLKTSATPVNRMRVGKRTVSRQANDPFVNPAANDYHLSASSPAIDKAVPTATAETLDIDGQARPHGAASDLGADELY